MKISDVRNFEPFSISHMEPAPPTGQNHDHPRLTKSNPSDLYQELEMGSRYVDTHRDITHNKASVQLHSHIFYEVLYCASTSGVEYLIGTERYKLQRGDIVFVAPGVSHRPILPESMSEPYVRDILWISDEFLKAAPEGVLPTRESDMPQFALLRTAGTRWEYIGELFHRGVEESVTRELGWETAVIANTMTLITHFRRAHADAHATPLKAEKPELLDQVLAYVEKHLSEKITMADVARHFFISESTITQTFRKRMGVSFYRCVTQRRLIAAKALIETGLTLDTVSEQVGFTDYSSFFRAFKQEFGISPRQYRKLFLAPSETK